MPPLLSHPVAGHPHHAAATTGSGGSTSLPSLAPLPSRGRRHRRRAPSSSPAAAGAANQDAAEQEEEQHQQPSSSSSNDTSNKTPLLRLTSLAPLAAGVLAARLAVMTARLLRLGRAPLPRNGGRAPPLPLINKPEAQAPTLSPALSPAGHDPKPPNGSPSGVRAPAIVWFRADLRTRDHAPLRAALASPQVTSILPVFVFDPREYPGLLLKQGGSKASSLTNTPTAGPRRAALVRGAVRELRAKLRSNGSDLLVRVGLPEQVLPRLVAASGATRVYCHGEGTEGGLHEAAVERAVARALRSGGGCELRAGGGKGGRASAPAWGAAGALLHPSDLPAALRPSASGGNKSTTTKAPTTAFGEFCQRVADVRVREPLAAPARLKGLPTPVGGAAAAAAVVSGSAAAAAAAASANALDPGPIPSMRELGFADADASEASSSSSSSLMGGEAEALRQLRALAAELKKKDNKPQQQQRHASCSSASAAAAETAAASAAFAARISPWLAVGCLSPREVFAELQRGGTAGGKATTTKNDKNKADKGAGVDASSGWLASQLLLRDFFGMLNAWRNSSQQQAVGAGVASSSAAAAAAAVAAPAAAPQLAFA